MLDEKLDLYEKTFGNSFPTYPLMLSMTDGEVIKLIDECVEAKKDVYEMGFLEISMDIKY